MKRYTIDEDRYCDIGDETSLIAEDEECFERGLIKLLGFED